MVEVTEKRLLDAWYVFYDIQEWMSPRDPRWDLVMDARLLLGNMMREKRREAEKKRAAAALGEELKCGPMIGSGYR